MKFHLPINFIMICICCLSNLCHTQTYLDTSFVEVGLLYPNYPEQLGSLHSIAEYNDGGLITLSTTGNSGAHTGNLIVRKYFSDGTQDLTFGESGEFWLVAEMNTRQGEIEIQSDGKILISGDCSALNFTNAFICRLNVDGTLDQEFGENGYFLFPDSSYTASEASDIELQSDEKIIVSGSVTWPNNISNGLIFRLNPNGTLDTTFGNAGYFLDDFDDQYNKIRRIVIDDEDAIVFAESSFANQDHIHFGKILSDGQVDDLFYSFDQLGYGIELTIDDQNRIFALARLFATSYTVIALNNDGTPNLDFSDDGLLPVDFFDGWHMSLNCIVFREPGKLVLVGTYQIFEIIQNFREMLFIGIDTTGQVDNSFGENGVISTDIDLLYSNEYIESVYIQMDGKIMAAARHVAARFGMTPIYLTIQGKQLTKASIGPIPASNFLNINADIGYKQATIKDMSGRTCLNFAVYPNMSIDISSISSGMYILSLHQEDGSTLLTRIVVD